MNRKLSFIEAVLMRWYQFFGAVIEVSNMLERGLRKY